MKVKITCPKCSSTKIDTTAEEGNSIPMYKCKSCGYKNKLFPQIGNKEEKESLEETRSSDAELED